MHLRKWVFAPPNFSSRVLGSLSGLVVMRFGTRPSRKNKKVLLSLLRTLYISVYCNCSNIHIIYYYAQNRKRVIGFALSRRIVRAEWCAYGNNVHNIRIITIISHIIILCTYRLLGGKSCRGDVEKRDPSKTVIVVGDRPIRRNRTDTVPNLCEFQPLHAVRTLYAHVKKIFWNPILYARPSARYMCFFATLAKRVCITCLHLAVYLLCCTPPLFRYYLRKSFCADLA